MLFALFKKWWGWDIFHPTRTYSSLKFNLKCDFRVLSSFIYYHHHLWYIVVICRTKNLTFLWASFRKWLHLLAANDLKEQRNWICQKFLMDFPQPELYLPPLIFTKLSFFWDTLYMRFPSIQNPIFSVRIFCYAQMSPNGPYDYSICTILCMVQGVSKKTEFSENQLWQI